MCRRHICTVWKAYLEGMVQVTQSRLNDCDSYRSHVCDPIKTFRLHKEQQLKRVRAPEPKAQVTSNLVTICRQERVTTAHW